MVHAILLAVAGFVSRLLGLLYAVPLYHIIGEEGNGYYGTAYEIYNMLLLITAYSIPMAISKIMSVYVAEKDYVNCKRLFKTCIAYVVVVGGVAAYITYAFADKMVIAPAALALKVMAPTIFFSGFLSVLRGYTQAHNTMVPTALSQIVEQIFNAACSIILAYLFVRLADGNVGARIRGFLGIAEDEIPASAYGAMGSALGTLIGVLVALLYMVINIMLTKKQRKSLYSSTSESLLPGQSPNNRIKPPVEPKSPEPYFTLFRVIFVYASPIILTSFIYNISTTLDMKIFWNWARDTGYSLDTAASIYGIYSRQYLVLINVPITIASAISSSMLPGLSVDFSTHDVEAVKKRISKSIRSVVLFAVPSVVGLMIFAEPIMQLLFKGTGSAASDALTMGSISVLFFSVATVLNSGLQAMGKSFLAIKNVTKALIIHLLYVVGMLKISGSVMGILVGGSVLFSMVMCFSNIKSMEKYFDCKLRVLSLIGKPIIASLLMGVVAILSYSILTKLSLGNAISLLATIAVSITVYFVIFYFQDNYVEKGIFVSLKKNKG